MSISNPSKHISDLSISSLTILPDLFAVILGNKATTSLPMSEASSDGSGVLDGLSEGAVLVCVVCSNCGSDVLLAFKPVGWGDLLSSEGAELVCIVCSTCGSDVLLALKPVGWGDLLSSEGAVLVCIFCSSGGSDVLPGLKLGGWVDIFLLYSVTLANKSSALITEYGSVIALATDSRRSEMPLLSPIL